MPFRKNKTFTPPEENADKNLYTRNEAQSVLHKKVYYKENNFKKFHTENNFKKFHNRK